MADCVEHEQDSSQSGAVVTEYESGINHRGRMYRTSATAQVPASESLKHWHRGVESVFDRHGARVTAVTVQPSRSGL